MHTFTARQSKINMGKNKPPVLLNWFVVNEAGESVAKVFGKNQGQNAKLFAAAPELLNALKDVMAEADFGDEALAAKCRDAIAKAEQ